MNNIKPVFLSIFIVILSLLIIYAAFFVFFIQKLPSINSLKDYNPPLISTVLDREGRKSGEFFNQRRKLVPYSQFPKLLIQAFISAEDGRFFEHKGLNIKAILRAFLVNIKAGRKVQGGSTITQQVARSLLLSSKKTYTRKLKEAILATRMEKNLSKKEILYLYLNQIYLGHGVYGVGMAAKIYFRKDVQDLNLAEVSLLAGLPQAPSRFSPVYNPKKAKERQIYVLKRMIKEKYIHPAQADEVIKTPLKVFLREQYHKTAPYYLETLRQSLLQKIDESVILNGGLTIKTAMDLMIQQKAQKYLKEGLKKVDKRQGYRGPLSQLKEEEVTSFFIKQEKQIITKRREFRFIFPLSQEKNKEKINKNIYNNNLKGIKIGETFKAVVKEVNDDIKKVLVKLPFNTLGIISIKDMEWARTPNSKVSFKFSKIKYPSLVLKKGDLILVKAKQQLESKEDKQNLLKEFIKIKNDNLEANIFLVSLEQEPLVEGALIAFDQKTGDILALVGGYDFDRSQFNRAYQAARQTGSVFKPLVYLAALDKGLTPSTLITDAPVIYAEKEAEGLIVEDTKEDTKEDEEQKMWKPDNYGRRFSGDILFRNALIRSMNVPTVKLIEKIGIQWVSNYARRLGIFSFLNLDYTLALGSSSITLYEMTKVFSIIGRLGKQITPFILHEVLDHNENKILDTISLDERFTKKTNYWNEQFEQNRLTFLEQKNKELEATNTEQNKIINKKKSPNFFFTNPKQLISKQTSYIITTLLKSVIREPGGTGGGAKTMDWPIAGKTGTTNGYYDAWFIGYSNDIAVGVWVGFDNEQSLGIGETGGRAALPIWLEFMKDVHKDKEKSDFKVPEGIIFTYIDNKTGELVSSTSDQIVQQAFIKGTQPKQEEDLQEKEDQNFLRENYSE